MAVAISVSLPIEVISPADVARLKRAALELADYFEQQAASGKTGPAPVDHLLKLFAETNNLELNSASVSREASRILGWLLESAPAVHISFATEPSAKFIQKVASWFRTNINPLMLLTVGLQPSVAAGCYLRTTNRYFDLSLRRHLEDRRGFLIDKLNGLANNVG